MDGCPQEGLHPSQVLTLSSHMPVLQPLFAHYCWFPNYSRFLEYERGCRDTVNQSSAWVVTGDGTYDVVNDEQPCTGWLKTCGRPARFGHYTLLTLYIVWLCARVRGAQQPPTCTLPGVVMTTILTPLSISRLSCSMSGSNVEGSHPHSATVAPAS